MSAIQAKPVEYDGKTFASIREFVNYYGLNYSKVQYYRKLGKSPEEIVRECQFSSASKQALLGEDAVVGNRITVEYEGVPYKSIYDAAVALGINPSQVYETRKRRKVSASEAIRIVMERTGSPKRVGYRAMPCTVNGVEYASREEAILAYHLPRVTVYSRMEREGISFEEALVRGRNEAVHCPPTANLFPSLRLVPSNAPLQQPVLEELEASLEYYVVSVQPLRDLSTFLPVLCADGSTYLYFNHAARGVEIVAPLPFPLDYETINGLNETFATAKLVYNEDMGQLLLTGFQMAKETGQDTKPLLFAYFSFASVRDMLMKKYRENEAEEAAEA